MDTTQFMTFFTQITNLPFAGPILGILAVVTFTDIIKQLHQPSWDRFVSYESFTWLIAGIGLRGNINDVTLAVWTVEHIDVNIFTSCYGRNCVLGWRRL